MCCLIVAAEPEMLFDVGSHMDRLNIFEIGETGSLKPVQKLTDCLVIGDPGILIANRDREEFKKSFGRQPHQQIRRRGGLPPGA
jgi:hypothetical protein